MEKKTEASVKMSGIGTNKIDLEVLNEKARERVMDCIRKNGKVSIIISGGKVSEHGENDFAQSVD